MQELTRMEFENELASFYPEPELKAMWRWVQDEEILPDDLLDRLKKKEPVQYILGYTWFYNRKFMVSPHTLIPRPETEELCHLVLSDFGKMPCQVLDVGTGSGCIAVTICAENPNAQCIAIDISEKALDVAESNALKHGVADRIDWRRSDFLTSAVEWDDLNIIISNPPYIASSEASGMDENVLHWEPALALFPEGTDPLIFYKKLCVVLESQKGPCVLYAEINAALGPETLELFSAFNQRELINDWSGNKRFIRIKKGS